MKINKNLFTSLFIPLGLSLAMILGTGAASAPKAVVNAGTADFAPIAEMLSSDTSGLEYEIPVSWEELGLEEVEEGGRIYTRVTLPGWANTITPGLPSLPVKLDKVGAPFGGGVVVEVIPGVEHRIPLSSAVLPVETKVVDEEQPGEEQGDQLLPNVVTTYIEDESVYSGRDPFPGTLAEVTADGLLRQQRVVGISIYPVQFDVAAQELVVYESLTIQVRFNGGEQGAAGLGRDSQDYEDMLRGELLNYDTAQNFRTSTMVDGLSVESSLDGVVTDGAENWVVPNPGWRVKVRADGMYKISYEELASAGVPVSGLNPATLQLFNLGQEVALRVDLGADGLWNAGDYLVFYGKGIQSKYTLDNIYWLTYGSTSGLRMAERSVVPATANLAASYQANRHMEGGAYYLSSMPEMNGKEHFVSARLYPPSTPTWTTTFTQPVLATSPVTISVTMLGGFASATINPDHHVVVTLNGTQIGDVTFDGKIWQTFQFTAPAGLIKVYPETNTLVFKAPADRGLTYDLVYIDSIDLDYVNSFTAQDNVLAFSYGSTGTWKYHISGFTANQVQSFDVTNPSAPVRLSGGVVSGSGSYSLDFQDTLGAETTYWVSTTSALKTVAGVEKDTPSSYRSTAKSADYIVFTPAAFASAAAALRDYRGSQGLRALVVDVQDAYDEFSYGIVDPEGIHSLLAYAYTNWVAPAPSYVVLMGDGNYDPKNYLGFGRTSFIPPYLGDWDPWMMETASDNRYVTVSGADKMPDMMIGRLSVNSLADANTMVDKIKTYETKAAAGAWQTQVMAVADNADAGGYFDQISDQVMSCCVPAEFAITKVYYGVTHTDISAARAAVQANYGKYIVNYVGHGFTTGWASEALLTTSTVPELTNGGQQPIDLVMACMEGYFIHPNPSQDSLAEISTRAVNKGSIASWSGTGEGTAGGQDILDRAVLTALLKNHAPSLGAAVLAAKQSLFSIGASPDLLDTFTLFGDPALHFNPIPTAVDVLSFSGKLASGTVKLSWETASEREVVGFNLYRAKTRDGARKLINSEKISAQNPGADGGAVYTFVDTSAKPGKKYFYWLESISIDNTTKLIGPVKVKVGQP